MVRRPAKLRAEWPDSEVDCTKGSTKDTSDVVGGKKKKEKKGG